MKIETLLPFGNPDPGLPAADVERGHGRRS
jgi:hypothetical protein